MKYKTINCKGFYLPDNPLARKVDFFDVLVSTDSWDEEEDADDERIFYYTDGLSINVGDIIADGFVITEIEE